VEKHAKADLIKVHLAIERDMLTATVTDNGIGFDVEAISRNPEKWDHFGLRGIVERARLVGGQAKIESKKGRGTRVVMQVPLKKEAARDGSN
jgi:two-component system, NarL family, sensor histidine kinase DegS